MNLKSIKAGSLQLTLFVIVLIALLLLSFILFSTTHNRFKNQTNFIKEAVLSSKLGINHILQNTIRIDDSITVIDKNYDYKTLQYHRDFWGLFEKHTAKSAIKTYKYKSIGLVGSSQPKMNRTVLYLNDNNRPLILVGNTKIKGVAFLPKQGIKTGTIGGQSYYGSELIYGSSRLSQEIPELAQEINNHVKNINTYTLNNAEAAEYITSFNDNNLNNSFFNPLKVIYNTSQITLSNQLVGHIIVQSKTRIVVESFSKLKDIILIAPEIEIKDNTIGHFQAFATKKISVGKQVILNYPSSLVLIEDKPNPTKLDQSQEDKLIHIAPHTIVKGCIVYLGEENSNNYKPQIFVDDNATVIGEVYCNKNTELLGTIFGTVYTNQFVANQFGSIYQNHIYNGQISIDELPQEYAGILFKSVKKRVMKWLY